MNLVLPLVLALSMAAPWPESSPPPAAKKARPTAEEARRFADRLDADFRRLSFKQATADWVSRVM